MLKIHIKEAIKNIRANFGLNIAIIVFIVAMMTFAGIITNQLLINEMRVELKLNQEAFVEYSQYHLQDNGDYSRLVYGKDLEGNETPDSERFINYRLTDNLAVNSQYLSNCNKIWDFYRKLNNISGVYFETLINLGRAQIGQHDAYEGYYTPDSIKEFIVDKNFFKLEQLTYLEGRAPKDEDYYIDEDGFQVVPVVIGYQLREYFKLGDIIYPKGMTERYNPERIENSILESYNYTKGIVVGILTSSNSITGSWGITFYSLSDRIIKPRILPTPDNYPELKSSDKYYLLASFYGLNEFINGKIYINKTNEEQAVEEIRKAIKDCGLDELFTISNSSSYSKIAVSIENERTYNYLVIAFCVGLLCLFGLGILIVMVNIANTKDYSIHRLIGATKRDTAVMTIVQMFILLVISDILVHYPFVLSKTGLFLNGDSMQYIWAIRPKMYLTIAIVNVAVLIVTYVVSRIYTARIDIVTTIKDKE